MDLALRLANSLIPGVVNCGFQTQLVFDTGKRLNLALANDSAENVLAILLQLEPFERWDHTLDKSRRY